MSDTVKLKVPQKGYKLFKTQSWKVFIEGLWHNNPIFGMMLGLCSTLAVTSVVSNTLVMSISVTVVLVLNSLITSLLRNMIPERVRMIVYMLITSTLVIVVDRVLKIFTPEISRQMGPYVALIITNCIVMGRAEAFAMNNTAYMSIVDALGVGFGYSFSLLMIAVFREIIGQGAIFGIPLWQGGESLRLISQPPGAFFALGIFILVINSIRNRKKK